MQADQKSVASSTQFAAGDPPVRELPEKLYELVRAGVSNGIERAISDEVITADEFNAEWLEEILMEAISAPTPQLIQFIRKHPFPTNYRKQPRRSAEQEVYDFSRNLGVSISCAENWVLKAREFWVAKNSDSTDSSELSTDTREGSLDESSGASLLQTVESPLIHDRHYDKAPNDGDSGASYASLSSNSRNNSAPNDPQASNSDSMDMTEDGVQRNTKSTFNASIMPATSRAQTRPNESLVDTVLGQDKKIRSTEAVVKDSEEKAARKLTRKARKVLKRARRQADRHLEKHENRKGEDEEISHSEELSEIEQLENNDEPQQPETRATKRNSDPYILFEPDAQSRNYRNHEKRKVDRDAQDANPSEPKRKKRAPQQSPFFQQSTSAKEKKKGAGKKAEVKKGFQLPMIQ